MSFRKTDPRRAGLIFDTFSTPMTRAQRGPWRRSSTTRVLRFARRIGEQIRTARIEAKLSQAAVADRIGMTRGNYARIEHGETNVTIETLLRIAEGLGLDLTIMIHAKPSDASRRSSP